MCSRGLGRSWYLRISDAPWISTECRLETVIFFYYFQYDHDHDSILVADGHLEYQSSDKQHGLCADSNVCLLFIREEYQTPISLMLGNKHNELGVDEDI